MIADNVKNKETYFSHPERLFPNLDNGRIPTAHFINACKGISDFVGFFGTAFIPVKNDISGNVQKVNTKFEKNKEGFKYLQDLIDSDLADHDNRLGVATEGLLWLKRGLEFLLEMLKLLVRDYKGPEEQKAKSENLSSNLKEAYEKTLKRHHNFISKQLFNIVICAAPYRRDLLKAIAYGNDGLEEICIDHIAELLDNFETSVKTLVEYYYKKGLEKRS